MPKLSKFLRMQLLMTALMTTAVTASALLTSAQQPVSILAGDTPPLVIEEGSEGQGLILDMVTEAARRAGYAPQVTFMPWKRAQEMGAAGQDVLLVPVTRTVQREDRYTWIAPLLMVDRILIGVSRRADSLDQAWSQRLRVIVSAGSASEQALKDARYPSDLIISAPANMKEQDMLRTGRGDLWFTSALLATWRWKQAGYKEPLVFGGTVQVDQIYLACSRNCDPAMVSALAKAVESMRNDGTIDTLQRHYNYRR